jgi:hypothetical protein
MSWALSNLGEQIETKEGLKSTSDAISGKRLLGLYFSGISSKIVSTTIHN